MHLATERRTDRAHEILPQLLRQLQGQGYRLATISDLLAQDADRPAGPTSAETRNLSSRMTALIR